MTAAASLPELDLGTLDESVQRAIDSGAANGLRVLGYGEFTLVLGWPTERPTLAVKRLPLFRDETQLDCYRDVLDRYVECLRGRGVPVLPTALHRAPTRDLAGIHAYLVQPLVARENMLNVALRKAEPEEAADALETLVDMVMSCVDERVGLDAQAANWAIDGQVLATVDVSTPLLRDTAGRDELDLDLFSSIYPAAVRHVLARVAPRVMAQYHDPRTILVDAASNLMKERHERWIPTLIATANARVAPPITEREVRRYFIRDRRFWLLMQWLRRTDRAWQRRIRRRPYQFLMPPPYHYGPPEIHETRSRS
jgi:hypothetical protein